MKKLLYKLNRWFDLNISWFFVNGYKQDQWSEHLRKKYDKK